MFCATGFKNFLHRNLPSYQKTHLKNVATNLSQCISGGPAELPNTSQKQNFFQEKVVTASNVDSTFKTPSEFSSKCKKLKIIASAILVCSFFELSQNEGDLLDAKPSKNGILTSSLKEDCYEGDLVDGKFHGKGTYFYSDGSRYEGDLVDGKLQAVRVRLDSSGRRSYEGVFLNGKIHGKGIRFHSDGSRYEGDFVNNKFHGKGTYFKANGSRYEGDFENGYRNGKGTAFYSDGSRYEGTWIQDYPSYLKKNPNLLTFPFPKISDIKIQSVKTSDQAVVLQSTSDHNGAFGINEKHPQTISEALKIVGYNPQLVFFDSAKKLKEEIQKFNEPISLVWIRAHGSGPSFSCGNFDDADQNILSKMNPFLTKECFIILESCGTGKADMLAQKMLDRLCSDGKKPTIIAPNGSPNWRAIDLADLKERKLTFYHSESWNFMKDISQTFKCPN